MSTFRTACLKCGSVLPGRFCTVCGTDNEKPWLSWVRQYPRFALLAIVVLIGAVGGVVDENVDFVEKYAPKINAALHGGEITSGGDARYDVHKWGVDLKKLDDDPKDGDWPATRADMLSRKPYVDDLVLRNGRFQRRVKTESDAHLSVGDACETMAIREFAPLMERDTRWEQDFYALLKDAETPTAATMARIDDMNKTKDEINQGLSEFNEHSRSKGCK